MVGRKDGLMRFHKISPCPKCGGKVKAEMGGAALSVRFGLPVRRMQV